MGIKEAAASVLQNAYQQSLAGKFPPFSHKKFIDYVIDNTHLTYKYILFTALLAKATDSSINVLCLQKKSELPGAYDARSICHKVIVPFEMEILEKALGGSNEPFLNKPARFPELSKNNAVRNGNDRDILVALCDNLPLIKTSAMAYSGLVYLLGKLIQLRDSKKRMATFSVAESSKLPIRLMEYIDKSLEQSYEGETLTLLIAGIYHLMYNQQNARVEVHPVNQSGASGREVSDLDIYLDGVLISSNELKDKAYAETDIRHAADKVLNAGGTKMLFVVGPRGTALGDFVPDIEREYARKNFLLRVISCRDFFASLLGALHDIDVHEFIKYIIVTAQETKFKAEVITYLDNLAKVILGLNRE